MAGSLVASRQAAPDRRPALGMRRPSRVGGGQAEALGSGTAMLGRWLIAAVWPRAGSDAVGTSRGRPASLGHALD